MRWLTFGIPQEEQQIEHTTRHNLAIEVNEAIMKTFCNEREEKLVLLLKFMLHSQRITEEVPRIINLVTGAYNTE